MNKEQKFYIEELYLRLAQLLKTQVHAKGCVDVDFCPRHCSCRSKARPKKLDLHTAILWTAALHIENDILSIWQKKSKYQVRLDFLISYMQNFLNVISYHSRQYAKEEKLLNTIIDCLEKIRGFLNNFRAFVVTQEIIEDILKASSWKAMQTTIILNDAWMVRIECAVTNDANLT